VNGTRLLCRDSQSFVFFFRAILEKCPTAMRARTPKPIDGKVDPNFPISDDSYPNHDFTTLSGVIEGDTYPATDIALMLISIISYL
jgi:hypothetical protein